MSAFVRRVYRLVFAEAPDGGQMAINDDLSGVRRTEKNSDPPRRPIICRSQCLPSFGSYGGIVKFGGVLSDLIRLSIAGEMS